MKRRFGWLLSFWVGATIFLPAPLLAATTGKKKLDGTLNLNTATLEQLVLLPGVGPSTAQSIIETRNARPFEQPWEVVRAKGIGPKTFRKLEPYLSVSGETTLRVEGAQKVAEGTKEKKSRKKGGLRTAKQQRGPRIIEFPKSAASGQHAPPR